mgnify:CR=1 FL=1
MSEEYWLLTLPSADLEISGIVLWVVLILVVPAVLLASILYIVVKISSPINKKEKADEMNSTDGVDHDDGDGAE